MGVTETLDDPVFIDVVPDVASLLPRDVYTYKVPAELKEAAVSGARVEIPFGKRTVLGYIVDVGVTPERLDGAADGLKSLAAVVDDTPLLLPHQLSLARFVASSYCCPLAEAVKAMLPMRVRTSRRGSRRTGPRSSSRTIEAARVEGEAEAPLPLTEKQRAAAELVIDAIRGRRHRRVLLHGVTGSGKTEVYLAAIEVALRAGRQAIVMVPEIALTPQTIRRFAARFPGAISVLHSGLSDAERAQEWRRTRSGEASVIVGSRSAVFAPVERLGLVVIDEEDATAYKQDRLPRYHACDVAMELARLCEAPIVLGSATPRIDTFYGAHTGKLQLATLPDRVTRRGLPPIEVVDLREELKAGNRSPLSPVLENALSECAQSGGQSILFLNRRGTATVVLCRACGEALRCPNCSVSLVYHHSRRSCDCHYCGVSRPIPVMCPTCGSPAIKALGMGTERLQVEVAERFPDLRLLRMDRDTTSTRDAYFEIYDSFRKGEADCLIGTQMVAKGWDLGRVRLVGIVNADTSLHFPDYRSGELTFSLITQVAGRAGRGDEPARVILQTYTPDHYSVRYAVAHDYLGFAREELRMRKRLNFPPYSRLVVCTFSHKDNEVSHSEAARAARELSDTLAKGAGLDVLGPSPAFVHRLRGEYRWQVTIRGEAVERAFPYLPEARGWSIDVDPAP